jgi:hypothetical protein
MTSPLDALASLSLNASDPQGLVAARLKKEQALLEMKRNLERQAGDPQHTFSGATNADVADETSQLAESPNFGTDAQEATKNVQATNADLTTYNRPDVTARRNEDIAMKKMLAIAPDVQKGQDALSLEKLKGALGLEQTKQEQKPAEDYMARQAAGDPGGGIGTPGSMKPAFDAKGRMSMSMVPTPPQQISQQHAATVGLDQVGNLRHIVDTLDAHGAIGPVAGRYSSAATGSGLDSILMNPAAAKAFSDFKSQVSLAKSNMAMVHGGARGGSNIGMAQRFDQLMNVNQSKEGLIGSLNAFERWLTKYASAKSSAELDAADAELGIPIDTGGSSTPQDPAGIR